MTDQERILAILERRNAFIAGRIQGARQAVERCLEIAREEELAARGTTPENGRHEVMIQGYGDGLEELRTRVRAEFADVLEVKNAKV